MFLPKTVIIQTVTETCWNHVGKMSLIMDEVAMKLVEASVLFVWKDKNDNAFPAAMATSLIFVLMFSSSWKMVSVTANLLWRNIVHSESPNSLLQTCVQTVNMSALSFQIGWSMFCMFEPLSAFSLGANFAPARESHAETYMKVNHVKPTSCLILFDVQRMQVRVEQQQWVKHWLFTWYF